MKAYALVEIELFHSDKDDLVKAVERELRTHEGKIATLIVSPIYEENPCQTATDAIIRFVDVQPMDYDEEEEEDEPCVCGVYRSEHMAMGCGNFQTGKEWESEKEFITGLDDDEYERIYHPEEYR